MRLVYYITYHGKCPLFVDDFSGSHCRAVADGPVEGSDPGFGPHLTAQVDVLVTQVGHGRVTQQYRGICGNIERQN